MNLKKKIWLYNEEKVFVEKFFLLIFYEPGTRLTLYKNKTYNSIKI